MRHFYCFCYTVFFIYNILELNRHEMDYILEYQLDQSHIIPLESFAWESCRDIWRYRQGSNMRGTLMGNTLIDHSDVVGATSVGAAPATSPFST